MDCDKCWTCRIGNALNICDDTAETTSIISNQCSFCGENQIYNPTDKTCSCLTGKKYKMILEN